MLQRYELDAQVCYQNVTEIRAGHAVHYQNVAEICFGCSGSLSERCKDIQIKI